MHHTLTKAVHGTLADGGARVVQVGHQCSLHVGVLRHQQVTKLLSHVRQDVQSVTHNVGGILMLTCEHVSHGVRLCVTHNIQGIVL